MSTILQKSLTYLLFQGFLILVTVSGTLARDSLVIYEPPAEVIYSLHNDDFTVRVRKPGGEWLDLYEYNVQVDMDDVQDASLVHFDFSGTVEILIRKNNGKIGSTDIRPLSCQVKPQIEGNTIRFTLSQPRKLSVEVNGDKLHNLHVFANPLEEERPNPDNPDVIWFGPGVHEPGSKPGGAFLIPSGKTVYLHGGAIVKAKLVCDSVKDVRITGRGIIFQPERGVEITHSENITVEGITVVNPGHYTIFGGSSKNITIRNLKSFSCKGWSDGIDLMSCSDVLIDGVFMRNSDDCIAIYAHRWDFYGNARNYKIMNSTLWADIAHPANIGIHGNGVHAGDTIENIVFSNIDVLEHDEDDRNYQGCFSINSGDRNLIRNVTYEDIRIEDIQEGQLFNLRVVFNEKYSKAPGRSVENIHFKNITYNGFSAGTSIIHGYDRNRIVKGVIFENVVINGKPILDAESGNIMVGDFVENVQFKK